MQAEAVALSGDDVHYLTKESKALRERMKLLRLAGGEDTELYRILEEARNAIEGALDKVDQANYAEQAARLEREDRARAANEKRERAARNAEQEKLDWLVHQLSISNLEADIMEAAARQGIAEHELRAAARALDIGTVRLAGDSCMWLRDASKVGPVQRPMA